MINHPNFVTVLFHPTPLLGYVVSNCTFAGIVRRENGVNSGDESLYSIDIEVNCRVNG